VFTGLIEETGEVVDVTPTDDGVRLTIKATKVLSDAGHGDSICCSGVCLTVIDQTADTFTADVMGQTLRVSALDGVAAGRTFNLERAAHAGTRLGGHIVQGHVDGTATVLDVRQSGDWRVVRFGLTPELAPLLVDKGSVTVDGVSLTVSTISAPTEKDQWFEVSLIPETLTATTLGARVAGDLVNIETDIVARHVARMLAFGINKKGDHS
jgi:riboflavin synthase